MSCALSSSLNLSSPTLESKEIPYLARAVEKYHKIGKNHGKFKITKRRKLTSCGRKEVKFWSQVPSKDEIESRVHDLSNGLLQFDEKKN